MFTGDGSGDFLYPVLHDVGLDEATAVSREDGLELRDAMVTAILRCASTGINLRRRRS